MADLRTTRTPTILVVGLGNEIMGDDAVGLLAAREIRHMFHHDIEVAEARVSGLELLDLFQGYGKVLLLDSVSTGSQAAGVVREFTPDDFHRQVSFRPHYVGLRDALTLAKKLGILLPSEIRILAMEVKDHFVVRKGVSPEIASRMPNLVCAAARILENWGCFCRIPSV